MCVYFLFHGTAPTEIYPDCHTLSLHDALPIGPHGAAHVAVVVRVGASIGIAHDVPAVVAVEHGAVLRGVELHGAQVVAVLVRWEEHTSELQSLMRKSYAVSGLKTKIVKKNKTQA